MGFLLFLSSLLSWPIVWLFFAGSIFLYPGDTFPGDQNESSLLLGERSNIECWTLLLFAFVTFALAGPNLTNLSKKQIHRLSGGYMMVQPFLLAFLRWPQLVETIWHTTNLWSPTILCCVTPGVLSASLLNRHLGFSTMLCLPIASSLVMAFVVDLGYITEIVDIVGGEGNLNANSTFPWGLLLTIIASAWLSSLLIPYWFLWASRAERIDDERLHDIASLWKAFRLPSPKVYLWPTACRSSNAVLLGGVSQKKLLLTDKLLLTFDAAEIEWVILHELSHSIRHHALVRMLPTFLAVPSLLCLLSCTQGGYLVLGCLLLGSVFAGLIVATCWWTEWDADKCAIKLGAKHRNLSLIEASTQYGRVLKKLYGSNQPHRTSWTHPSLKHRLSVVEKIV